MQSARQLIRHVARVVIGVFAFLYFVIDLLFLSALRPVFHALSKLRVYAWLKKWIEGLGPYSTLAIFLIPLILLEPLKPLGVYLMACGYAFTGIITIVVCELLKIGSVEQIFSIGKPKLMTIPTFAWVYHRVMQWLGWIKSFPVVRWLGLHFREMKILIKAAIRAKVETIKAAFQQIRSYVRGLDASG